jgi:phenylalanyl-tRNA synthetase beta chain
MKIPFTWLSEFVDLKNIAPQPLAEEISLKAFEVEDVEFVGPNIQGPLKSGRIIEINKHPNADKLQVTKVIVDEGAEPIQIVCGARNIEVGQIVPVALPSAIVINRTNGEPLAIKVGKIRDVESCGMLCSGGEIGLEGGEGIFQLEANTKIGLDLVEELNLKPQAIFNVASRSNRGDALSLQGIAREVAATLNSELKLDYYGQDYSNNFNKLIHGLEEISSTISSSESCTRIGFLKITGVKITESPAWLTEKLKLAGISSINNLVDITNYVMLEIGQPMHAYDASKLNLSGPVFVRAAKNGEKIKTLDEAEYTLTEENLVIADSDKVLAIAGVMGGLDSAINNETVDILLEAACFDSKVIRRSSRLTGISTESSRRFERGTDPELVQIALLRAASLIKELAGGSIKAFSYTNKLEKPLTNVISLQLADFERKVGCAISAEKAISILQKLGFKATSQDSKLEVVVPSYRYKDVSRPIDVIEELVRFYGFNEVESQPLPGASRFLEVTNSVNKLKASIVQQGYLETIFSSLVSENSQLKNTMVSTLTEKVKMNNPLSKEHTELRTSLLSSLLRAVSGNYKRQQNFIRLFEIGKIYGFSPDKNVNLNERQTNTEETELLSLVSSSKGKSTDWQGSSHSSADFYEIKGLIEQLTERKGKLSFAAVAESEDLPFIHPKVSAVVNLNGRKIGLLGQIHPKFAKELEVPETTFFAELLLEPLIKTAKLKLKTLSDTPSLQRDFTIDLQEGSTVKHEAIEKLVLDSKLANLQEVKLLNLYKAAKATSYSLSYRLVFHSQQESLTSDHINQQITILKESLSQKLPEVSFRE